MPENNVKGYRESAMRDGTVLGLLWIVTFAMSVVMFKSIGNGYGLAASFATAVLSMMSPCVAYRLAVKHRNAERNGAISFGEAWLYIFIMYLCAIVLASIAQYIFYAFIDPHMFGNMIPVFQELAAASGLPSGTTEVFTKMFETMENTSTADIIMSQLSGHIMRDTLISAILAAAIRKTTDNS